MREILFKAKREDNGEWVEGYYVKAEKLDNCGVEHYIIEQSANGSQYLIKEETLCRYAELPDKNGNKIWEHDILIANNDKNQLMQVKFGEFGVVNIETEEVVDDVIGWYYQPLETDLISKLEPFCLPMTLTNFYIDRCEFKVYGNIFDNPELLRGNKDDK